MADQYAGQQIMGFPMAPPMNPFAQRGQTDLMLLNQLSQGFSPVVTAPAPQMRTGFESLPGFNQPGMMGLLMNQFLAPQLQRMMGRHGMIPGGLSSQNILDYQEAQQFRSDQKFILQQSAAADESSYYDTLRGMQALTGQPFNAPQRAAARRLASTAAGMTPSIAPLAPELIDSMAGRTGSAAVMAMRMQQFNRFRTDPVTGLTGYSRESNAAEAEKVFETMYAPENMANMRGMRAGQVGQMYGEMMRRGMVGADARPMRQRVIDAAGQAIGGDPADAAQVRDVLGLGEGEDLPQNLDTDQLDKLRGLESVQGNLRSFNATAVKSSLEGYVKAVTTMREIFGDAGVSNAPMSQLIQGLEALSQGTMTQIDPGSLNMMVRTTQQLARQSGMTIDAAIMMQQQGATTLQNLGVERNFAPQVTQGAMAFGQAATQAGVGANPAWGMENMDFQRQLDQNLRSAAVASPAFNALSALVRGQEQFGTLQDPDDPASRRFNAGPQRAGEAAADFKVRQVEADRSNAMVAAIKGGQTTYTYEDADGNIQTANLYEDQFRVQSMLIQQGRNQGLSEQAATSRAQNIMLQRAENRETGFRHEVGGVVRRLQPEDVRRQLLQPAAEGILQGVEGADSEAAGAAFADAALSMDRRTATNQERRIETFVEAIRGHVPKQAGESERDYEARLRGTALQMEGQVNERIHDPNSQYSSYLDIQNLLVQQSVPILEDTAITRRRAALDAGTREAMSGLTGHGVLANLVTAVQEAGDDPAEATMAKVLGKTFGGVDAGKIAADLDDSMTAYQESRDKITRLEGRFSLAKDSDEKRDILGQMEEEQLRLRARTDQLRKAAEQHGLLEKEGRLDVGDISAFRETDENVRQNRMTAAALLLRPDARREGETDAGYTARRLATAGDLLDAPVTEDVLLEKLAPDAAEDADDAEIAAVTTRRQALMEGTVQLTPEEQLTVLEHRRDAIRITPTEAEVSASMPENLRDNEKARRLYARALTTENRIRKTGVTAEQIRERTEGMELPGVGDLELPAEDRARIELAQREELALSEMTGEALTGGLAGMDQRDRAWAEMSREDRDVIRKGWDDRFDALQHLVDETGGEDFIRRTGGAGLDVRDKLQETLNKSMTLRARFGGDSGAAAAGVPGRSEVQIDRFARHAEVVGLEQFFDAEGNLLQDYATGGLEGEKLAAFKGEEGRLKRAQLGARHTQLEILANDRIMAEGVEELDDMLGKEDMSFTDDRGEALTHARRLMGKDAKEEDVAKTASAMQRVGGLNAAMKKAVLTAGRGGTKIDELTEADAGKDFPLKDFKDRVRDYRLIDEQVEGASGRALAASLGDPSRALKGIGESLGLDETQVQDLRKDSRLGAKFATGEGQAWARVIKSSTAKITGEASQIEGTSAQDLYTEIRGAISGDERAAAKDRLKKLTGRDDIQGLLESGRMLEGAGLLDTLAEGKDGADLKEAILKALDNLQKSEKTTDDVKPQYIELSGDLHISKDNQGSLTATGGLHTSGIG